MDIRIALLALGLVSAPAWPAPKIQCWTDEQGHRACGDSVSPKDSMKERRVIDEQGRTVGTWPRAPTPAEQDAAEKAKIEEAKRQKEAEHQHNYDRYLLESYNDVHDLEITRDQRLKALEVRMDIVKKAIESGQQQLDRLVAQKQELQRAGKPIDKKLEESLREYRRMSIDNPKALEQLKIEHGNISNQFERDIARYQELKQASAAPAPAP